MKKVILLGIIVVLAFAIVIKFNHGDTAGEDSLVAEATVVHEVPPTTSSKESVVATAEISASADGKDLKIRMSGGNSNNFGRETWGKGEIISFSVTNSEEQELEIGLMSVETEEIISETLRTGTGIVEITIPEDGVYRIYIKNHAPDPANFEVNLNKELLSPLV